MPDDSDKEPEDEFRDMLREFLSGNSQIDPSQLAGAAGLPNDPEMIAQLITQLQSALQNSTDGINWDLALQQGKGVRRPHQPVPRSGDSVPPSSRRWESHSCGSARRRSFRS